MLGIFLYGLLGMCLTLAGVNVVDKPLEFICITAVVVLIDLNRRFNYD